MFGLSSRQKTKQIIPFKKWIKDEYLTLHTHPWHSLAWDINTKWQDFPENKDVSGETLLFLELWLFDHGACSSCQTNFKGAWSNYVSDIA